MVVGLLEVPLRTVGVVDPCEETGSCPCSVLSAEVSPETDGVVADRVDSGDVFTVEDTPEATASVDS